MTAAGTYDTRLLLRGEESGGRVAANEMLAGPDFAGPPLHTHDFDETFYVLEGELTFQLGDRHRIAGAGELVFAPRGVAHTLANLSGAPARYLLVCTPSGFERHLARTAAERDGTEPPAWALGPTPPVQMVGPQISGDALNLES